MMVSRKSITVRSVLALTNIALVCPFRALFDHVPKQAPSEHSKDPRHIKNTIGADYNAGHLLAV